MNGYFDTCSREKTCKIYNLRNTKLSYTTILSSAMPIKKRFIELFMNFSLCENTIFFSMLKKFYIDNYTINLCYIEGAKNDFSNNIYI